MLTCTKWAGTQTLTRQGLFKTARFYEMNGSEGQFPKHSCKNIKAVFVEIDEQKNLDLMKGEFLASHSTLLKDKMNILSLRKIKRS